MDGEEEEEEDKPRKCSCCEDLSDSYFVIEAGEGRVMLAICVNCIVLVARAAVRLAKKTLDSID